MSARNVGNPLLRAHNFGNIKEFMLVRNHLNVLNVERPLLRTHSFFNIRESTQMKNHMNVINVERPLINAQILPDIWEFIVMTSLKKYGKTVMIQTLFTIREFMLMSNKNSYLRVTFFDVAWLGIYIFNPNGFNCRLWILSLHFLSSCTPMLVA